MEPTRDDPSTNDSDSQAIDRLSKQVESLTARMDKMEATLHGMMKFLGVPATVVQAGSSNKSEEDQIEIAMALQEVSLSYPDPERQFKYTPLEASRSEIRILMVRRALQRSDPLVMKLVPVSLDDDSISRLIGGGAFWMQISYHTIFGSRVATRTMPDRELNIWVDQICINQSDMDERAAQVSLMRRIYKQASSVQVWLGDEADDSSLAINLLEFLANPPKHAPGEKSIVFPTFTEEELKRHWNALAMFFRRPWWERVWIKQEVELHHTILLWCGHRYLDIRSVAPALVVLAHVSPLGYANMVSDHGLSLPWNYHPTMLAELRGISGVGQRWVTLAQLLRMNTACKATDPRDAVFSILGIADPETHQIVPGYHQDLREVMLHTIEAALKQEYGLESLGVCQNVERNAGLPSWIPCFTDKWRAIPFKTAKGDPLSYIRMPHLTYAKLPNMRIEGERLELRGAIVDTIQSICCSQLKRNGSTEFEKTLTAWKRFATDNTNKDPVDQDNRWQHFFERNLESKRAWIRFLTALDDAASDVSENNESSHVSNHDAALSDSLRNPHLLHYSLNPKLARCCLLPPADRELHPHADHRILAGLQSYGAGRCLARTFLRWFALVPSQTRVGDSIVLFEGATFPYVLRKVGNEEVYALVGEAFIPSWSNVEAYHECAEEMIRQLKPFTWDWIQIV